MDNIQIEIENIALENNLQLVDLLSLTETLATLEEKQQAQVFELVKEDPKLLEVLEQNILNKQLAVDLEDSELWQKAIKAEIETLDQIKT
ncbi:hypothetical protein ACFLZY_02950 [Patescibacteria group bacterium]